MTLGDLTFPYNHEGGLDVCVFFESGPFFFNWVRVNPLSKAYILGVDPSDLLSLLTFETLYLIYITYTYFLFVFGLVCFLAVYHYGSHGVKVCGMSPLHVVGRWWSVSPTGYARMVEGCLVWETPMFWYIMCGVIYEVVSRISTNLHGQNQQITNFQTQGTHKD